MYKCSCCGDVTESPRVIRERHGFTYGGYEEYFASCNCGGEYEEAIECEICGGAILEEDLRAFEGLQICVKCYENENKARERRKMRSTARKLPPIFAQNDLGGQFAV